jgi:D-glycero-beta-D-manno-heptose 1-phosphate adenylyltransferase
VPQREKKKEKMDKFDYSGKIKKLEEALIWREELKKNNKKVVVTNGCFDVIHRGHLTYLMNSRRQGDVLLLAVNSDDSVKAVKGPSRPVNNEFDRTFVLSCFPFIDAIVVFSTHNCDELLMQLKPDIYIKGADYTLETMVQSERKILESIGSEIRFLSFVEGYSSTDTIDKMKD